MEIEWMGGWMDRWLGGCNDVWMIGWNNGGIDVCMDEQVDEWLD